MELTKYNHLNPDESQQLYESLDQLLADYQVAEKNARKMYWSTEFKPFLDFHFRLGQLYESNKTVSNLVANTIMQLGYTPGGEEEAGLARSNVQLMERVPSFEDACLIIVRNSQELLHSVKQVFEKAAEFNEQHTMQLMSRLAQQLVLNIHFFLNTRSAMVN